MSTHVISSIYFQTFNKILANIEQIYLIDDTFVSTQYLMSVYSYKAIYWKRSYFIWLKSIVCLFAFLPF